MGDQQRQQHLDVMFSEPPTNPRTIIDHTNSSNTNNYQISNLSIHPIPTDLLTVNDLPETPTIIDSQFANCFDDSISEISSRNSPPIGRTTVATSLSPTLAYSSTLNQETPSSILCSQALGVPQEVPTVCTDSGFSSWTTTGHSRPQFSPALISSDNSAFLNPTTTIAQDSPSNPNQSQDLFISNSPPILSNLSCTNALNEELSDTMFIGTMSDMNTNLVFLPNGQECWSSSGHEGCSSVHSVPPTTEPVIFCPLEPPDLPAELALDNSVTKSNSPNSPSNYEKNMFLEPVHRNPGLSTHIPIKQPLARHATQSSTSDACCLFPSPSSAFRRRVSIKANHSINTTHWYRMSQNLNPSNSTITSSLLRPLHFNSRPSSAPLNYHSCIQEEDLHSDDSDCWIADQPEIENDGDVESDSSPTQPTPPNIASRLPSSASSFTTHIRSNHHYPHHPHHRRSHFQIRPRHICDHLYSPNRLIRPLTNRSSYPQVDYNRQSPYLPNRTDDSSVSHDGRYTPAGDRVQRTLGSTSYYGDPLIQPNQVCILQNPSPGQTLRRQDLMPSPVQARPMPDVVPQIQRPHQIRLDNATSNNCINTPRCSSVPLTLNDIEEALTARFSVPLNSAIPAELAMGTSGTSASIHDSSSASYTDQERLYLLAQRMAVVADEFDATHRNRQTRYSLPNDSFISRMRAASSTAQSLWHISSSLVSLVTYPLDYVRRFMEFANLSLSEQSSTTDTHSSSAIVVHQHPRRRADTYTYGGANGAATAAATIGARTAPFSGRHSLNRTMSNSNRQSMEFVSNSLPPNPTGRFIPGCTPSRLAQVHTSTPHRSRIGTVTYYHPNQSHHHQYHNHHQRQQVSPPALNTEPCHSARPSDLSLFSFDSN